ncbi:mitoguardin 1-like isoform X2 [Osmerus mordax]|uniref:mitoguardin 1-like isoform X2 n=1 Tax=Osmerus mordax TaxID=8014 RepID=UPI003510BDC9
MLALRESFHSLLTQDTTKNFLLVAGRMILSGLVQLNQADVSSISTSFNRLVSYTEDPAHRAGIERELASVNIHHTNFLDIVYDFIILGVMKNNAALPPQNQEQGFLDHLFKVLEPILTPPTGWQPCAKMFQEVLQVQLIKLLDSILDLDESTFSQADVLSAVLFSRLEGIIQELLGDLDGC